MGSLNMGSRTWLSTRPRSLPYSASSLLEEGGESGRIESGMLAVLESWTNGVSISGVLEAGAPRQVCNTKVCKLSHNVPGKLGAILPIRGNAAKTGLVMVASTAQCWLGGGLGICSTALLDIHHALGAILRAGPQTPSHRIGGADALDPQDVGTAYSPWDFESDQSLLP
jgi:hypothetical protein